MGGMTEYTKYAIARLDGMTDEEAAAHAQASREMQEDWNAMNTPGGTRRASEMIALKAENANLRNQISLARSRESNLKNQYSERTTALRQREAKLGRAVEALEKIADASFSYKALPGRILDIQDIARAAIAGAKGEGK